MLTFSILCLPASFHPFHSTQNNAGEKLVNFMVEPKKGTKWPKDLPKFKSRSEVIAVCKNLCSRQFMHRSEKVAKGELEVRNWLGFCNLIVCLGGRHGNIF